MLPFSALLLARIRSMRFFHVVLSPVTIEGVWTPKLTLLFPKLSDLVIVGLFAKPIIQLWFSFFSRRRVGCRL